MRWRRDLDSPKIVIKTKLWSPSSKSTQTKPTSSFENRKDRFKSSLLASTTSKTVHNVKIRCREVLALALVSNSLIIRRCSQFTTEFKIWDSLSWIRTRGLLRKSNQKLRISTISAANFAAGPPHPLWSSTKRRPIKWWRHSRRMHSRSSRRWCTRSRSQTQEPKTRRESNQSRQARWWKTEKSPHRSTKASNWDWDKKWNCTSIIKFDHWSRSTERLLISAT